MFVIKIEERGLWIGFFCDDKGVLLIELGGIVIVFLGKGLW